MIKSKSLDGKEAIKRIGNFIAEHNDWRGETLARIRAIIHEVAPDVIEDWKNMGSRFWSHEGILGHGNIFKAKVKRTLHRMPRESSRLNTPLYFALPSDNSCRSLLHP